MAVMGGYRERKFELAVAATILGVLFFVLLRALNWAQREMEEAMVQAEASALRIELLDRLSHREAFGGQSPTSLNPVAWAGRAPPGYVGELDGAPHERGIWYFERRSAVLVYRFQHGGEARFRLVRMTGAQDAPAALAGVGLLRLENGK